VAHHLCADLDQLLLQQRPVLDRLRRRQRAQEIAEVVGERMKLEPHRIGGERSARQSRPLVAPLPRYVVFQMAEVAVARQMFQEILRLIAELRPQPPPALT